MSSIDRQLRAEGYVFRDGYWCAPDEASHPCYMDAADSLHALLVQRAGELAGCAKGSEEERQLAAITDAIDAYEAMRWPNGKVDTRPS